MLFLGKIRCHWGTCLYNSQIIQPDGELGSSAPLGNKASGCFPGAKEFTRELLKMDLTLWATIGLGCRGLRIRVVCFGAFSASG